MILDSFSDRFGLARKIASVKPRVAQAISDEFFAKHPEWIDRYGERGRQLCTADACFHMEFLAGAIESGSPESFADYARWTARMLGARGIASHTLVENLAQLEKHLSEALLPEEQRSVSAFLALGRGSCADPGSAISQPASSELDLTRHVFLTAVLGGQRQNALNIVEEALHAGHTQVEIYLNVFAKSLHRVGELWEMNKISVAQEHMATSITQFVIAAIYPRMVSTGSRRGTMVVTGVAGELHQVGSNLVADTMEANGWAVRFLGTNLPSASVLAAVEESSADVLGISTTIVANLPAAAELVRAVRSKLNGRAPRIILGGGAYRFAPQFAREVGATEIFDLREALAVFCG
jgi:methanogenic corrinoid protein MtbC1